MNGMIQFLQGKKTYIVAIITGILGAAEAMGYHVSPAVYAILGSLGLIAVRSGINTAANGGAVTRESPTSTPNPRA